tara:strand:+ start:20487 stop:20903 length:417 start_codon:yes stop_codon:yes gene_type:complete
MMMSKNFLRNELLKVVAFTIVVAAIHYLLLWKYLPAKFADAAPWRIYAFLVPATILGVVFIVKRFQKDHKSVANSFMLFTILKMIAALIFLGIIMFYIKEPARPIVYQFFALFFPFLFLETRLFVRMLSYSPSKFEKN